MASCTFRMVAAFRSHSAFRSNSRLAQPLTYLEHIQDVTCIAPRFLHHEALWARSSLLALLRREWAAEGGFGRTLGIEQAKLNLSCFANPLVVGLHLFAREQESERGCLQVGARR